MSEKIWKKFSYYFALLPIGAIFGLAAYMATMEIKDLDLWLHLAMGRFITFHQYVPHFDILSNSISGHPWNNHEWMFQILIYNIASRFGMDGLLVMQSIVVVFTMLILLFIGYNKDKMLQTTFGLLLVFLTYQSRFTVRPDLFSLTFFAMYIYVLALHIDKKWSTVALFIIQVIWSNVHGFFFFGPLFVLIGLFSEWTKRHVPLPYEWNDVGRLTQDEYKRLKFMFIVVSLACLINPGFIEGALYPVTVFFSLGGENAIFFDYIVELKKPITMSNIWEFKAFGFYKLFIFISFVSFVINRRRIDVSALIFWLIFLFFSLKAVRNTPFFAFAAYLVFITNLFSTPLEDVFPIKFKNPKFKHITSMVISVLILTWVLQFCDAMSVRGYYDFDKYERKSEYWGVSQRGFPNQALDFIVANNIKGNIFNDFNSGAYILGRAHPHLKVYIDGRTEVYGGSFFKNYQEIYGRGNGELFEIEDQKYNFSIALLNSARQILPRKIFKYLYEHEMWKIVYFNYDGVVFLKDIVENKELIDKYEIDMENWESHSTDLVRMGPVRLTPYRYYNRAYSLELLDLDDAALKEAQKALDIMPNYADPYDLIGKIYAKKKESQKAFEYFRIATILMPNKKTTRHNLGLSLLELEEYTAAQKQYNRITMKWPSDPKGYFFLSKAYALEGDYEKMGEIMDVALAMDSGAVKDVVNIADSIFENEDYDVAQKIYERSIEVKENAPAHYKIGLIYQKQEKYEAAKLKFEKALIIDEDNEDYQKSFKEVESLVEK